MLPILETPVYTQNVKFIAEHFPEGDLIINVSKSSSVTTFGVQDKAPGFKLRNHKGKEYQLSQYPKIKLLTFGAIVLALVNRSGYKKQQLSGIQIDWSVFSFMLIKL